MVDPKQLSEELRRIKKLIQERPDIRERFDKDGNGIIDGEEWEEVRKLVIHRLERREAEAREREVAEQGAHEPAGAGVAEEVVHADLARAPARATTEGAVGDLDEIILRQEGSLLGQMMERVTRRHYSVRAPSGRHIATILQAESELLKDLGDRSLVEHPTLSFHVHDLIATELLGFRRQSIGLALRMDVVRASGAIAGHVQTKPGLLKSEYQVASALVVNPWKVVRPIWHPFDLDVTDAFGEKVGVIHRQWSGLGGFLTGSNQMHLELSPSKATPDLRWALVACMVLVDLAMERRS